MAKKMSGKLLIARLDVDARQGGMGAKAVESVGAGGGVDDEELLEDHAAEAIALV